MNTNQTPHDPLETAEAALRELPSHIVPSTDTLNRIATLVTNSKSHSTSPTTESSTVRGWRKAAALLLTSAAALAVASYVMMHTPRTTFAFEEVVAAVRKTNTVSYTTVLTPKNGPASQSKNFHKGTLTRMVNADGSYVVMDMAGQKMLVVQPAVKTATMTHFGSKPQDLPTMGDSIIAWLKTAETTGKAVGEKTIDGVRTLGFVTDFGATTMTLWGDPKTKLPVQIEAMIGPPSEPIQMVLREFVFNARLEDALFSTTVPDGFQVKETKLPAVDYTALMKLPPEEHVVRILKFHAKLNGGAFPERIDGPELVAKITSSAGEKGVEDPEFMKELTTLAGSMGATWTFRQSLNKFGYLGAAHLNDADSIVFWYLPEGARKYRVVFADLTIGDVPEEKLPKLPMK
jgi:outer membrane lipoprotein-sorting protein